MRIVPVTCLADNYAYLVICEKSGLAAVVDPSEAAPIVAAARKEAVELAATWNTHHHGDHTGGNVELGLPVYAPSADRGRIPGQTGYLTTGDEVSVGEEVRARVIENPGHTRGAISFYLETPGAVFTGDTLFGAGCGRLFEGTPGQMHASLLALARLPAATRVYCGHEYTVANLKFAAAVEPDNEAIAERRARVDAQRASGLPSVPFAIAEEKATNPFLRVHLPAVIAAVLREERPADEGEVAIFGALRRWKDRFSS